MSDDADNKIRKAPARAKLLALKNYAVVAVVVQSTLRLKALRAFESF